MEVLSLIEEEDCSCLLLFEYNRLDAYLNETLTLLFSCFSLLSLLGHRHKLVNAALLSLSILLSEGYLL